MMDIHAVTSFAIFVLLIAILVSSIKLFINHKASLLLKQKTEFKNRIIQSNQLLLFIKSISLIISLVLTTFSLYKIKSVDIETTKEFESSDILFVVDVSLSMNAVDVKPTRLKRFQDLTLRLLPDLKGNRVGIIVFAGQSFSFCPMTSDVSAVSDYIQSLGVEMVGTKGTNLANALERVGKVRQKNKGLQPTITIIVSDGEDHENQSLPNVEGEVMVWGIGTEEGGPIEFRDPSTGNGGFVTYDSNLVDSPYGDNVIQSKLNLSLLESIADKYSGDFYNVSFYADGAYQLTEKIKSMKKKKIQRLEKFKNEDGAHPYLLFALLFFFIERILSIVIQKKSPLMILVFFLLLFVNQNQLLAWELDPGGNAIERGLRAYKEKNYNESQKEFSEAKQYIQDDPRLLYNESANAYQLGKFKESRELSEKILSHPKSSAELKSKANLTLGNIYSKMGQTENALNSYIESLKQNPNQVAAKKNIEHLTKKKQSNQNPSQNQGQDKKNSPNTENHNKDKKENQNSNQNQSDLDRIFEPFSHDSILKNKKGGSNDNEKFW